MRMLPTLIGGTLAAGTVAEVLWLLRPPRGVPRSGTQLAWFMPGYDDSSWTKDQVGPGPGNQPNGIWFVRRTFPVLQSGTYTIQVSVDDACACYLNGLELGVVTFGIPKTFQAVIETYRSGFAALFAAEVVNNDMGTAEIVPNGSGSPNPTEISVTITDPSGQTVLSTGDPTGWRSLLYPSSPPPGAQTQGSLT